MIRKILLLSAFLALIFTIAACGSVAEPEYQQEDHAEEVVESSQEGDHTEEVVEVPTEVPTATPIPPTEVPPTEAPTETPIPPTEVPPTEAPVEELSEEARIAAAVAEADAGNGESLFTMSACGSCHRVDSDDPLVGPGLLNVLSHAETRVEGQGPHEYLFISIRASQAFVVEGFPAGVMPTFDQLTDDDIYDIIAYLATLGQ